MVHCGRLDFWLPLAIFPGVLQLHTLLLARYRQSGMEIDSWPCGMVLVCAITDVLMKSWVVRFMGSGGVAGVGFE